MFRFHCVWLSVALLTSFASAAAIGQIQGVVKFPGETPPPYMFSNGDDPDCPNGIAANHLIVDQTSLGLKNAVVALDAAAQEMPPGKATLSESGCVLRPRVQAVPVGTSVEFVNADEARHELHVYREDVSVYEVPLPQKGSHVRRPLVAKGFYRVDCDRHLWERAWIFVSDHPFATVTGDDGRFVLAAVPPGRYHLWTWHEGWVTQRVDRQGRLVYRPMRQTLEVTVSNRKTTEADFDSLAPASPN